MTNGGVVPSTPIPPLERPPDSDGRCDRAYGIAAPTREQVERIAERLGLHLEPDAITVFHEQLGASIESYRRVRELPEPRPDVRYPRTPGVAPRAADNPHGAWAWRCDIPGASDGSLLAGRTVALKDNVCVAGVPLSNGSAVLEGFVPDVDATVVTRILDAGGTITGKAVAEAFGLSSGSNTAATGAVRNPVRTTHSAGGSSSGSAALVAASACDIAIGSDQGGSVRIPASLCGVVGLKPTFGLVPYTGVLSIEPTLDHLGVIARSVGDVASMLEAIAGADGMDPRQRGVGGPGDYVAALDRSVAGVRVGILNEGFALDGPSSGEAEALVRRAVEGLSRAGVTTSVVSVPAHADAGHIVTPIYAEGIRAQLLSGGLGYGWRGFYPTCVLDFLGRVLPASADRLSDTGKLFLMLGEFMTTEYQSRYYARAQNQTLGLRAAYDEAFRHVDVLAMPTCAPSPVAQELMREPSISDVFAAAFGYHANTAPFNVTEHPAITVPCGEVDGLPVGLMLVGRHFEEPTLLRVARAVEHGST